MRSQRSGVRRNRRIEGKWFASRKRAVTPLAAIMKSSISSVARFFSPGRRSDNTSPLKTGRSFDRVQAERAVLVPLSLQRLRHAILKAKIVLQPGHGRDERRYGAVPVHPCGERCCRRASPGSARALDTRPSPSPCHRPRCPSTPRSPGVPRSWFSGSEIGRQPSPGASGTRRLRYRRWWYWRARGRRWRIRGDRGVDIGDGDEHADEAGGERFSHRQLVEIPRIVIVDRGPRRPSQIADGRSPIDGRVRDGAHLGDGRGREVGQQPAVDHCAARDVFAVVAFEGHRRSALALACSGQSTAAERGSRVAAAFEKPTAPATAAAIDEASTTAAAVRVSARRFALLPPCRDDSDQDDPATQPGQPDLIPERAQIERLAHRVPVTLTRAPLRVSRYPRTTQSWPVSSSIR